MERRNLLKGALALTAFSLMPACKQLGSSGSPDFMSGEKFLSKDELAFLSSLSDTIIPATDTPGAVAAKVPETLQDLLSIWASDETRGNWRMVLDGLKAELDKNADGNFTKAAAPARAKALGPLDAAIYADQKHKLSAYHNVKKTIGEAYYMSEIGATQELRYNPVPGEWKANVPAQKNEKNWAA